MDDIPHVLPGLQGQGLVNMDALDLKPKRLHQQVIKFPALQGFHTQRTNC